MICLIIFIILIALLIDFCKEVIAVSFAILTLIISYNIFLSIFTGLIVYGICYLVQWSNKQ